jgi:L-seryl-tRNA(Ser) seleniumtransferase
MENKIIKSKRDIPSVEFLASDNLIAVAGSRLPRPLVVEIARSAAEKFKSEMESDSRPRKYSELREMVMEEIRRLSRKKIGKVINGAGILVHTNLGRAPLSDSLFDAIKSHATGYGNLELDVNTGKRGKRGELAEKYLATLSGAESACIVNNNAAALFLIVNALANKKEVVISRGELVQIGGGFRIPDIIRKSGARLIEVGTTNITAIGDYESALDAKTALILKVHRSNFSVRGFAEEVELKALAEMGRRNNIPVVNDLGSGVFVDTTEIVGYREPTVQSSVKDGASLTCFSGDKLLGGAQAGLIVGKKPLIDALKKNPIYRALRVDKIVFSAAEEMLKFYLDGGWRENIKLWRLAARPESELYEKGRRIIEEVSAGDKISLDASFGEMGGGSLPDKPIPSVALAFRSVVPPQKLAELFLNAEPPVVGRISKGHFMIDLKAIDDDDAEILIRIIKELKDSL